MFALKIAGLAPLAQFHLMNWSHYLGISLI